MNKSKYHASFANMLDHRNCGTVNSQAVPSPFSCPFDKHGMKQFLQKSLGSFRMTAYDSSLSLYHSKCRNDYYKNAGHFQPMHFWICLQQTSCQNSRNQSDNRSFEAATDTEL